MRQNTAIPLARANRPEEPEDQPAEPVNLTPWKTHGLNNRTYRIEGTTNLNSGIWSTIQSNIPGIDGLLIIPDTNGLKRMYYRIGVESP